MAPFAAGVGYAFKRNQSGQVVLFCIGDGGVATNDFNVLMRAATIHRLPIIIAVEDNGWAITTPTTGHQWGGNLVDWAEGAGAYAVEIDGIRCGGFARRDGPAGRATRAPTGRCSSIC